jgi:hypothetical protein
MSKINNKIMHRIVRKVEWIVKEYLEKLRISLNEPILIHMIFFLSLEFLECPILKGVLDSINVL